MRVHRFERLLQRGAQRRRRRAADDDRQQRVRALLDPDREVADFQRLQPLVLADLERVPHEVADRGQHAGHHVGVLRRRPRCRQVLQQQARGAVDQEDLLDAVDQRVEQDDFGERPAGPPRVEPPLERTPRQAVLERGVERLEHPVERRGDGLADRRTDDREQCVRQRTRVAAHRRGDRVFNGRSEGSLQVRIAGTKLDGRRQHAADVARLRGRILEPGLQRAQLALFRADEQRAQLGELSRRACPRDRAADRPTAPRRC